MSLDLEQDLSDEDSFYDMEQSGVFKDQESVFIWLIIDARFSLLNIGCYQSLPV